MEAVPDHLSVRYVLDATKEETGDDNKDLTSVDNPKLFLQSNGVRVSSEDSAEDIAAAASALEKSSSSLSSFWQRHHILHPNAGRVKNWMWIHQRYRSQATALLDIDDKDSLLKAFTKFHGKIEKHSAFEDTQLFSFFVTNTKNDKVKESLRELTKQHENIRLENEIIDGLKSADSVTPEIREKIKSYVEGLKGHLDLEERTLVGSWLQLDDADYKKYRSGLSWAYWFMY